MRPAHHSHWRLVHLTGDRSGPVAATNGAHLVVGQLTLTDLENLVRLACFVTPRATNEQELLIKIADELHQAGGADLRDDVYASAGSAHYSLPIPESKGAIVTATAVVVGVGAGIGALRRRGHRRQGQVAGSGKAAALAVLTRAGHRHLSRPHLPHLHRPHLHRPPLWLSQLRRNATTDKDQDRHHRKG